MPCGKIIKGPLADNIEFLRLSKKSKLSLVVIFLFIDTHPIFFKYQPNIGISISSFLRIKKGELKIVWR